VSTLSIKNHTLQYFKKNEEKLLDFYPGLNLFEFERVIKEICERLSLSYEKSLYQEILENHLTLFFKKLNLGIPFAYILGETYFYKNYFFVEEGVFIPRSETEILVEQSVKYLDYLYNKKLKTLNVLEIGCGSGSIINSILIDSKIQINAYAVDISDKAIEVTKRNYLRHCLEINNKSSLEVIKSDRFENLKINKKFDLIVCNPPYIKKTQDFNEVHHKVVEFEPDLALFLNDEEYEEWFDKLILDSKIYLEQNGLFFMEGHERHLPEQKKRYESFGFSEVELLNDYTHRPRFLLFYK
jgi:release factor glutamine methyltransferase